MQQNIMIKPEVNVLWTGGWDSTFRVITLSRLPVTLKTYYVVYPHRRSRDYELKAIREIFDIIKNDPKTLCKLEPVNIVKFEDIPPDREISDSFKKITEKVLIGPQYEYLARFAKTVGTLEIGIEVGGLAEAMFRDMGNLIEISNEIPALRHSMLEKNGTDEDLYRVFHHFTYPLLQMSKLEMKEEAIKEGFIDTMYKTWFCHFPRNGKPCGTCFPCHFTIEDGLGERFTEAALRRHKFDQKH